MEEAFRRIECKDEPDWLGHRKPFMSASEAAYVPNQSPFMTAAELWDVKTGRVPAKDISKKPYVIYGKKMEPLCREQAKMELPYFDWAYHQYDILVSKKWPYMSATLDGELIVTDPNNPWEFPVGTRGVYEGKTGSFITREHLARWCGESGYESLVPPDYWIQGLHQLAVTGWDFVIYSARLKRDAFKDEDLGFPEIRTFYRIMDRRNSMVQEQIEYIAELEGVFYREYWQKGVRPSRILTLKDRN